MNEDKSSSLAFYGGERTLPETYQHPKWPVIDKEYEQTVLHQMNVSMSIYNRSGVIEEFEDKFAELHNAKYALLGNSGTNAIWSMLASSGLKAGDEVLCPTYTFFATNTPLLSSGLVPVFCDADENGNFNADDAESRITDKTKAVIITHMWGYPCDMDKITAFCEKYNLMLFEDCSHAHLATYKGERVGSFGKAAAWSLQGQKNITGGEGGILVTNDEELYYRANLHGHYNKRCKQEIPESHPLHRFATTGMGLKMRSHPLAVAFANQQLAKHDEYQTVRNYCAEKYEQLFTAYPFISTLSHSETQPSWYAFVLKFDESKAKISREQFVELLHAEGLAEVDIPGSTGPNHKLPIFNEPHVLFSQFYDENVSFNNGGVLPNADKFYGQIIKLPTWTREEHKEILAYYIKGLKKVLDYAGSL